MKQATTASAFSQIIQIHPNIRRCIIDIVDTVLLGSLRTTQPK
jgi:hypothetical protein